jgi:hypothetical protein
MTSAIRFAYRTTGNEQQGCKRQRAARSVTVVNRRAPKATRPPARSRSDQVGLFGRIGIRRNGTIGHGRGERRRQKVVAACKMDYGHHRRQHRHAGTRCEAGPLHARVLIDATAIMRAGAGGIRVYGCACNHLTVVQLGVRRRHGKTYGDCHDEHGQRYSASKREPHGQRRPSNMSQRPVFGRRTV